MPNKFIIIPGEAELKQAAELNYITSNENKQLNN